MLLPTIYAVSAAFKPLDEIYIFPPRLFVRRPTLDNFVQVGVLADTFWVPLSKYVFNTVFISVTATVGHLVLSSMAAYPLAKHSFVGKNLFSNIVKWSLLFTSAAMLIPQYIVMSRFGMINTYWAYILPSVQSALGLYLMMNFMGQILRRCIPERAEYYTAAVREVIGDILKYHYKPELKCVLETVASDGSMIDNPAGRTVNPGHSCENSWFIMCEALYSKDDELMKKALNLLDWHTERGWDKENGGMFYFVDVLGRPCEQLEWDMKLWWVHNEVLISTLLAYAVTKDKKYWDMFEKTYDYTFSHFADREYGEWYGYLHRDGSVSHTQKGSLWKGPFHLPRCLMLCEEILTVLESNGEIHSII